MNCDFIYSIFASALPIVIIQLILYPIMARIISPAIYVELLTRIGIVNMIFISLGTPLENTRLISNERYVEESILCDFNILLISANLFGIILISIIFNFIFKMKSVEIIAL